MDERETKKRSMRILIFSGTSEGRILSERLADAGHAVTVSVATEYGKEEQGSHPGVTVVCGRKTAEEIGDMLLQMDVCIDATHPYAVEVTDNIRIAVRTVSGTRRSQDTDSSGTQRSQDTDSSGEKLRYFRLLRPAGVSPEGTVFVSSAAEAAEYLKNTQGNVLLTTGAKELSVYAGLDGDRLYPRVLPLETSLAACSRAGIPARNIIAMQGPFSEELNLALLHSHSIRYLVTKDGGAAGGFPEKITAAEKAGAAVILIVRPEEDGFTREEIERQLIGNKDVK